VKEKEKQEEMKQASIQDMFDILYNDLRLPKDLSKEILNYANPFKDKMNEVIKQLKIFQRYDNDYEGDYDLQYAMGGRIQASLHGMNECCSDRRLYSMIQNPVFHDETVSYIEDVYDDVWANRNNVLSDIILMRMGREYYTIKGFKRRIINY